MVEPEGVAEFMDGLLRDAGTKRGMISRPQPREGYDRRSSLNPCLPEDELVRLGIDIYSGDPEHAMALVVGHRIEERVRAVLTPLRVLPFLAEGGVVQDSGGSEAPKVLCEVLKESPRHTAEWPEGNPHPFTTPSGTIRATIVVSPAPSATRTTCSTSLYAPGASSTIPAFDAAWR